MLIMLLVGWAVVIPAVVVIGLYVASAVLGRRARQTGLIDVTSMSAELAGLLGDASATPAEHAPRPNPRRRQPVGSGY